MYKICFTLVSSRKSEITYQIISKSIQNHIDFITEALISNNDENFLNEFKKIWEKIQVSLKIMSDVFKYLEKNYIFQKKQLPLINLGYSFLKKLWFTKENSKLSIKFQKSILNTLSEIRHSADITERDSLKSCIHFLVMNT